MQKRPDLNGCRRMPVNVKDRNHKDRQGSHFANPFLTRVTRNAIYKVNDVSAQGIYANGCQRGKGMGNG